MTEEDKSNGTPETPRQDSSQATWPADSRPDAPGAPAARAAGPRLSNNALWVLVAVGASAVVLLVAVAGFGLGFAVGRANSTQHVATNAPAGLNGSSEAATGQPGQRLKQLQQFLQKNNASLVQGKVDSFEGKSLTIETASGKQTIATTQATRYLGAGAAGAAGGGAQSVTAGKTVLVVTKKAADGSLQALAIRVRPANAQQPLPGQPQQ